MDMPPSPEVLVSFVWWQWVILGLVSFGTIVGSFKIAAAKDATIETLNATISSLESQSASNFAGNMEAFKKIADEAEERAKKSNATVVDVTDQLAASNSENEKLKEQAGDLRLALDQHVNVVPYDSKLIDAADALATTASTTSVFYNALRAGVTVAAQAAIESQASIQLLAEAADVALRITRRKDSKKGVEFDIQIPEGHPLAPKKDESAKDNSKNED